jgi:hypothetical protein
MCILLSNLRDNVLLAELNIKAGKAPDWRQTTRVDVIELADLNDTPFTPCPWLTESSIPLFHPLTSPFRSLQAALNTEQTCHEATGIYQCDGLRCRRWPRRRLGRQRKLSTAHTGAGDE